MPYARSPDLQLCLSASSQLCSAIMPPAVLMPHKQSLDTKPHESLFCFVGWRGSGHECQDVDECSEGTSGCDHTCINEPGTYYCKCDDGFNLVSACGHILSLCCMLSVSKPQHWTCQRHQLYHISISTTYACLWVYVYLVLKYRCACTP